MSDDSTGDAEAIEAAVEAAAMQHSLAEPTEAGWLRCSEAFRKAAMNIVRPGIVAALPILAKHAAAQALRDAADNPALHERFAAPYPELIRLWLIDQAFHVDGRRYDDSVLTHRAASIEDS